jgi:serine/threonine protein kinase
MKPMTEARVQQPVLLELAVEGVVPVLAGCAGALAGGPEGGLVGVAAGQALEKVINYFGGRIVRCWGEWFRSQPVEVRQQAIAELASLDPEAARQEVSILLERAAPSASPADRELALEYLSLLPGAVERATVKNPRNGQKSLPPTHSWEDPQQLLALLPTRLPPYRAGTDLAGTPYRLERLLGTGGFGAVYRASTRSLQHLPLAIKFCLDPSLNAALQRERDNLERLMKAGGQGWSPRIVKLYGYELDHATPYLVYEYVTGGDLIQHLASRRETLGRPLDANEVLELIVQITEALAFAHRHGLVHRDLKPANVLVEGGLPKLADFGLGGISAERAIQVSRIGATTLDLLSVADQASLFRGAGTPLYMSPEQRRGAGPDPRHDLFSLGVMWYQLLVGDVSRELHPGWAKELALRFNVPRSHIDLIERCVGWVDERPRNAEELLTLLRAAQMPAAAAAPVAAVAPASARVPSSLAPANDEAGELRQKRLRSLVQRLVETHRELVAFQQAGLLSLLGVTAGVGLLGAWLLGSLLRSEPAAVMGFILFAAGTAAVFYANRQHKRAFLEETRTRVTGNLGQEYPEEVRSWGGASILNDPDMVHELARRLSLVEVPPEPSPPRPGRAEVATDQPLPALEPAQRVSLAGKLQQVITTLTRVRRLGTPKGFPFPVALGIGLLLGVAAGVGLFQMYLGYLGVLQAEAFPNTNPRKVIWRTPGLVPELTPELYHRRGPEGKYFDSRGYPLNESEYPLAERRSLTLAGAVAVCVGLGVGVVVAALLAWVPWYRRWMLTGAALGLIPGGALGVGVALLYGGLCSPYFVEEKVENRRPIALALYDSHNHELSDVAYILAYRQTTTSIFLIGVSIAVGGLLIGVVLAQLLAWRQARRVRASLPRLVAELADTFPRVIEAWGGREALQRIESARGLLEAVERVPA